MAVVKHTNAEIKLLARLMRAEAEGEGKKGMLCVGNVVVNRCLARCYEFKNQKTIEAVVMKKPGGVEATSKGYFYQAARKVDIDLAKRNLNGEKFHPASYALWFYNPFGEPCRSSWWDQSLTGKYKNHCFYSPDSKSNCY